MQAKPSPDTAIGGALASATGIQKSATGILALATGIAQAGADSQDRAAILVLIGFGWFSQVCAPSARTGRILGAGLLGEAHFGLAALTIGVVALATGLAVAERARRRERFFFWHGCDDSAVSEWAT